MYTDLSEVEAGVVVSLRLLRKVLKGLQVDGRRSWIACDPADVFEDEGLVIGFGHPQCEDPLNTITFRLPILNDEMPNRGPDSLVVLVERSTIAAVDREFYIDNGRIVQDGLEDRQRFFEPLHVALVRLLTTGVEFEVDQ